MSRIKSTADPGVDLKLKNSDSNFSPMLVDELLKTIDFTCMNIAKCSYNGTLYTFRDGKYKQAGMQYVSLRCPRCFSHQGRVKAHELRPGMTNAELQLMLRG